ncbi:PTS system D-glucosamine-specific IIC component [Catenibacillus scindens]|uniref:PTS system D-glucosamine-specific IIC component n=1 Tax=Catenibacillus scindens TaxID=673271 RepID=A0A7W8H9B1_9FIRM|nr:PTS transporter subunit IIABC [Catenibacillus scindens]MBB5264276.1 PTS system D-glucosamine-specific IIC component [Catenibacillus scindens]
MKDKIFGVLQRIGRSFMLPIAVLPVAGLLLGLGSSFTNATMIETYNLGAILGEGTILHGLLTIMSRVGSAIFDNLPLIFAVGVAIGMAKKEKEVAALSSMIAFFVMHTAINAMLQLSGQVDAAGVVAEDVLEGTIASMCGIPTLQMGVFGGVIVGIGVAALHNRFYKIQMPNALSFFGGSRFVPIISTIVYLFVGIAMYFVWPLVQDGIYALGGLVTGTGYIGTLIFGLIKRALIPFGLHHVFYMPFWQTAVGGTMEVAGQLVQGGQNIFFAQLADPTVTHFSADATRYFSGEFIFMIFGLPGAALAMYRTAKPEKRKQAGGLLLSAALASMFTGITEPIEFSFLFVAPMLFGVQVILAGSCYMVAHILNIAVGLTFSGGFIDLLLFGILQGNAKTSWILIIPCGIIYFLLYYFIFTFLIKKFNLKTPGREDDDTETKLYTKADYKAKKSGGEQEGTLAAFDEKSAAITLGLGGKDNISDVDCCATRLRITVKDSEKVRDDILKSTGSRGIVKKGQGVQVIYGPQVAVIKSNLEDFLDSPASDQVSEDSLFGAQSPEPAQSPGEESKEISDEKAALILTAPLKGTAMALEDVGDGVFSEKMLGDGMAIEPDEGKLYAPADGQITMVFDTKHAIGMTAEGGVELLLHMGIDTVQLNGQYFDVKVKDGDKVKQGDLLAVFDMEAIKGAGYRMVTPVIITNTDDYSEIKLLAEGAVTKDDPVLSVK